MTTLPKRKSQPHMAFFNTTLLEVWQCLLVLCGTVAKNLSASAGDARDAGSVSGSGRSPREGNGNPLQYSCLENPHGQRSLMGHSPWGRKESDTTEWLNWTNPSQTLQKKWWPWSFPHFYQQRPCRKTRLALAKVCNVCAQLVVSDSLGPQGL